MKKNTSAKLDRLSGREIIDSRGNPTVEVEAYTQGWHVREEVPSGASTGSHEALELRDGGPRFGGKGVLKAVKNIDILFKAVKGFPLGRQKDFDKALLSCDPDKNKLGANAILGASLAYARLSAQSASAPVAAYIGAVFGTKNPCIPIPFMNVINGGKHAGTNISFQEHMIVPFCKTFAESLRAGCEVYAELKKLLHEKHGPSAVNVGDEGGFAPPAKDVHEPFLMLSKAVQNCGYEHEIMYAIDAAASSFYDSKRDVYKVCGKEYSPIKLAQLYEELAINHPIISIEDPFEESKFDDFASLRKAIGHKTQIVGDDLTVSQPERVALACERKSISSLLLKVNQVGTVSEALDAARIAMNHGCSVMVSHRSGETESTFIADLAVGIGCGQIKTGAPCRGERTAKYNQLLRLEEACGKKVKYAGRDGWKL